MTLFFEFYFCALSTHSTVLLDFEVLPGFTGFALFEQTNGADAVPAHGASHREDGTLSSWHSCGSLSMRWSSCKWNFGISPRLFVCWFIVYRSKIKVLAK